MFFYRSYKAYFRLKFTPIASYFQKMTSIRNTDTRWIKKYGCKNYMDIYLFYFIGLCPGPLDFIWVWLEGLKATY